jgi:hypothetical protein
MIQQITLFNGFITVAIPIQRRVHEGLSEKTSPKDSQESINPDLNALLGCWLGSLKFVFLPLTSISQTEEGFKGLHQEVPRLIGVTVVEKVIAGCFPGLLSPV